MISYCVSVYNEIDELLRLMNLLQPVKKDKDEIVILQTYRNDEETKSDLFDRIANICRLYADKYKTFKFDNHFADMKNKMSSMVSATNEYIVNFDADETMDMHMLNALRSYLEQNKDMDVLWLPRANIVNGLTEEDIKKWSWNIGPNNLINWPDYQSRVYRISTSIKWNGKVHEKLEGYDKSAVVDPSNGIFISHIKNIDKQRQQNDFYQNILS